MHTSTPSPWRSWLLAIRPKTLPAAASSVLVGWGISVHLGQFQLLPAVATLLCAIFIQIGTNLVNDVVDGTSGADTPDRLGPTRVTATRLLTPQQVWAGTFVVFAAAALCGLYLAWFAGWVVLAIGAACMIAAYAYSAGPFPLVKTGLVDVFCWLFFGFIAVGGTVFAITGAFHPAALWGGFGTGALITAILVVNNIRDMESDRKAGRINIPARLGRRAGEMEYVFLLVCAFLAPAGLWVSGLTGPMVFLSWLVIPIAISLTRALHASPLSPAMNLLLARTSQLTLWYSLLLALGIVLS